MVTGGVTLGTKRISKLFPSVVQGMAPMVTHGTDPVQMTVGVQGFVSHSADPAKTIFPCTFTFKDGHSNVELDLTLSNDKYPHDENRLLQFNNGFVAAPLKGTGLGQLYYSYPNVVAEGSLTTVDAKTPVSGTAWIDHQGGGAGSPADYRLPGYWARVLAGAAGAPPAKVTLSREGGTQWRWFAVHMDEADGTRSVTNRKGRVGDEGFPVGRAVCVCVSAAVPLGFPARACLVRLCRSGARLTCGRGGRGGGRHWA